MTTSLRDENDFLPAGKEPVYRHERKFIPSNYTEAEVLQMIRGHPALFRRTYPARSVNSVYFDSPELVHYNDHVNGAAERFKIRIRWYGDLHGPIPIPALELKIKSGAVGHKLAYRIPPLFANGHLSTDALNESLDRDDVPEFARLEMRFHQPSLAVRYRRQYFVSSDGLIRLTLDSRLEFYHPNHLDRCIARSRQNAPEFILELKYAPEHSEEAARVANEFPFRTCRCSKYVLGIDRLR